MKILILGDPNKFFRLEYAKNMKKYYPSHEIHIASNVELTVSEYSYDKVIIFQYDKNGNLLSEYIRMTKQIKEMEMYDYIHIHSANLFWIPFLKDFKKKCKKIILTYYGSDFYRAQKNRRLAFLVYNSLVDKITFTGTRMFNDVSKFITNKRKVRVIPFGNRILDDIDLSLQIDKETLKEDMSIDPKHVVITVGYNATKQQRHAEILTTLERVIDSSNTTVLLPLNYGNEDYKNKLIAQLKQFNLNIKTYDAFLSGMDIANLRAVSDIMIHMQDSDQFSASIVEYLYAENILINCSWIDYKELKEWGSYYKEVDNFEELETVIHKVIDNLDDEKHQLNSRTILKEKLSWNSVAKNWNELYD